MENNQDYDPTGTMDNFIPNDEDDFIRIDEDMEIVVCPICYAEQILTTVFIGSLGYVDNFKCCYCSTIWQREIR